MFVQNLKFVAIDDPEIIGGTQKNWAVPGYAHASFSPKFLMGICSDGPSECTGHISNKSIAFPVPEVIGVPEKIGQSLDMATLPFV